MLLVNRGAGRDGLAGLFVAKLTAGGGDFATPAGADVNVNACASQGALETMHVHIIWPLKRQALHFVVANEVHI